VFIDPLGPPPNIDDGAAADDGFEKGSVNGPLLALCVKMSLNPLLGWKVVEADPIEPNWKVPGIFGGANTVGWTVGAGALPKGEENVEAGTEGA